VVDYIAATIYIEHHRSPGRLCTTVPLAFREKPSAYVHVEGNHRHLLHRHITPGIKPDTRDPNPFDPDRRSFGVLSGGSSGYPNLIRATRVSSTGTR
jgi:hypothetical protein